MTKTRSIPFAEFRAFLKRLGYAEHRAANARVFKHPREGRLLYRLYRDDKELELHDIVYTRKFLDLRGVIETDVFEAAFLAANKPA
jgi:hypothetical protein